MSYVLIGLDRGFLKLEKLGHVCSETWEDIDKAQKGLIKRLDSDPDPFIEFNVLVNFTPGDPDAAAIRKRVMLYGNYPKYFKWRWYSCVWRTLVNFKDFVGQGLSTLVGRS